jgi:hypothetical protein
MVAFTVVTNDGQSDSHQVKRQRGNRNGWSLRELEREGSSRLLPGLPMGGASRSSVAAVSRREVDSEADTPRSRLFYFHARGERRRS